MKTYVGQDELPSWARRDPIVGRADVFARKEMFRPFRCWVSVVECNSLNYCLLPTYTPAAEVSVIGVHAPPTPRIGGVGRQRSRLL